MYRAVALAAVRSGLGLDLPAQEHEKVVEIARSFQLEFIGDSAGQRVLLDGEDVTLVLREPAVTQMSSVVSAIPAIRREMVRRQRELAAHGGGVVEGRDIGTVVFPNASLKVFLTASPEVRAQRRFDELQRRGARVSWEEVSRDQLERDRRDSTRSDSPLKPAPDAFVLDTSALSLAEVVARILSLLPR